MARAIEIMEDAEDASALSKEIHDRGHGKKAPAPFPSWKTAKPIWRRSSRFSQISLVLKALQKIQKFAF